MRGTTAARECPLPRPAPPCRRLQGPLHNWTTTAPQTGAQMHEWVSNCKGASTELQKTVEPHCSPAALWVLRLDKIQNLLLREIKHQQCVLIYNWTSLRLNFKRHKSQALCVGNSRQAVQTMAVAPRGQHGQGTPNFTSTVLFQHDVFCGLHK